MFRYFDQLQAAMSDTVLTTAACNLTAPRNALGTTGQTYGIKDKIISSFSMGRVDRRKGGKDRASSQQARLGAAVPQSGAYLFNVTRRALLAYTESIDIAIFDDLLVTCEDVASWR